MDLTTNYMTEDYVNKYVTDHVIEEHDNQYYIITEGYMEDNISE